MAYINISMEELVNFLSKNAEYDRRRIKDIRIVNKNHIQLIVSIGQFFPDMKVELVFNRYEKGKIYFNILSAGTLKILIGLMNELSAGQPNNIFKVSGQNIVIDLHELISSNVTGVKLKDVNVIENQIYITLVI